MLRLLRQRNVALLWVAGLVSIAGDWMLTVALPIVVYELTHSATAVSGVVVAQLIPSVVLSSVAGVLVDRWNRKWTMVFANCVRGPVLLLLLAVGSADRLWLVYAVVFINSTVGCLFDPAESALLPALVDPADLVSANALNALNANLAGLVGPALGGVVAAAVGLGGVAILDGASYLIAAALIAAIAVSGRVAGTAAPEAAAAPHGWRSLGREWLAGLRLVRANRTLIALFAVVAVVTVGDVGFRTLLAVFVAAILGSGARTLGWFLTGQALGGLAGAALLGAWGRKWPAGRLLAWGMVGFGILDLALYNYPAVLGGIWLGILLKTLCGVPVTAINTSASALLQGETADSHRGRVFGALGTTLAVVSLAVAPIAGLAAGWLGVVATLSLLSSADLAAGLLAFRFLAHAGAVQPRQGSPPLSAAKAAELEAPAGPR